MKTNQYKKILVVNDDGIDAAGIRCLVTSLAGLEDCEVYVAAPKEQQSAKSQSITFLREITAEKREVEGAKSAYSIDGTPADCVIWAVNKFREDGIEFDFVISGINMGANVGLAAYYSGTIAAAREGALNGIRSIALSGGTHMTTEFDYICAMLPDILELSAKLSVQTVVSVNTPDLPADEIKGTRIAEIAPWGYGEKYLFHETSAGKYQMSAVRCGCGSDASGFITDVATAFVDEDGENLVKAGPENSAEITSGQTIDPEEAGGAGANAIAAEKCGRETSTANISCLSEDQPGTGTGRDSYLRAHLRYDYDCMENGYAAITPIAISVHDREGFEAMKRILSCVPDL